MPETALAPASATPFRFTAGPSLRICVAIATVTTATLLIIWSATLPELHAPFGALAALLAPLQAIPGLRVASVTLQLGLLWVLILSRKSGVARDRWVTFTIAIFAITIGLMLMAILFAPRIGPSELISG